MTLHQEVRHAIEHTLGVEGVCNHSEAADAAIFAMLVWAHTIIEDLPGQGQPSVIRKSDAHEALGWPAS